MHSLQYIWHCASSASASAFASVALVDLPTQQTEPKQAPSTLEPVRDKSYSIVDRYCLVAATPQEEQYEISS
jgi:hypothetical protein